MMHDKKQEHLPGSPYEHYLKRDMGGKVGKEAGMITGVIADGFLTGEIGIGNSDLFQDIFTGGTAVLPAVTEPVLVGRVRIA